MSAGDPLNDLQPLIVSVHMRSDGRRSSKKTCGRRCKTDKSTHSLLVLSRSCWIINQEKRLMLVRQEPATATRTIFVLKALRGSECCALPPNYVCIGDACRVRPQPQWNGQKEWNFCILSKAFLSDLFDHLGYASSFTKALLFPPARRQPLWGGKKLFSVWSIIP